MDPIVLKKVNYTLSAQNITPYDILLALGNEALVPDDVVKNRRQRVLVREGRETPEGYLRNAIEDLEKIDFASKDEMLALLRKQSGSKLAGFGYLAEGFFENHSVLVTLAGIILLVVPVFLLYKKKKKSLVMVSGIRTSTLSRRKRRKKA